MELRRQFAIVRAWLPLLLATTLLGGVATFLFMHTRPDVYQASTTLLPEQLMPGNGVDYANVSVSRLVSLSTNYAFIARSQEVLSDVATKLDITEPVEELAKQVDTQINYDTAALTIRARAGDPGGAAALANALGTAIEERSSTATSDEALQADIASVRQRMLDTEAEYERLQALPQPRSASDELELSNSIAVLRQLQTLYDSLSASQSTTKGGLQVIEKADALGALKVGPLTFYYTLLGAFGGLLVGGGIVALREYLDDRLRDPATVEDVVGLATLGSVPRVKGDRARGEMYRLVALLYPRSSASEAYRILRANIEFAAIDDPMRTLLITSSVPGEGKTVTAANLATLFAQTGRSVLLVDADLRKPGVHRIFNLPNTQGLTTLLRDPDVSPATVIVPSEQAGLQLLTAGPLPPNPAELFGSQRMRKVVERLQRDHDLIVFDSPPVQAVTDAAILSSFIDGTIMVIDADTSRRNSVRRSREALARAGARILGVVLNRVPEGAQAGYYGYYAEPESVGTSQAGTGHPAAKETDSTVAPA